MAEYDGYDYVYNEEALRDVDMKMVAEFQKAQVELLGGDEDLFEKPQGYKGDKRH